MKLIWVEFFYLGVREGDGGMQRDTILIWGYASTKRLRTLALNDHTNCVPHLTTFIFVIFVYVIASIAYIHPVYGAGV